MEFLQSLQLPAGMSAMLGGVALLYAAAQSLSGTIWQAWPDSPGRRAIWHAIPIGVAGIVAASLGHGEMAVGILTGSAVAALSLAPGVCRVISPETDMAAQSQPLSVLLLAPSLMLWLIGLRAEIGWLTAIFLAIEGMMLFCIWRRARALKNYSMVTCFILVLATGVSVVASVLAIRGAERLHDELATLTPAIFSAGIIAPILILPLLGESVQLAELHRVEEARTMQVVLAAVNLTIMIPLCVLASYLRPFFSSVLGGGALVFPLGTWRVDSVALILLAVWIFSGPALSRWGTRVEGAVLIIFYGAYLISLAQINSFL